MPTWIWSVRCGAEADRLKMEGHPVGDTDHTARTAVVRFDTERRLLHFEPSGCVHGVSPEARLHVDHHLLRLAHHRQRAGDAKPITAARYRRRCEPDFRIARDVEHIAAH